MKGEKGVGYVARVSKSRIKDQNKNTYLKMKTDHCLLSFLLRMSGPSAILLNCKNEVQVYRPKAEGIAMFLAGVAK